ncbi:MAG: hypothetical protein QM692_17700, partial [Thermomicrobiales bacterium]
MEHHDFDDLSRALVTSGSRRAALATLVGGALALPGAVGGEAKKRGKNQREDNLFGLKPISMWVDNVLGQRPIIVEHGEHYRNGRRICCRVLETIAVGPGQMQRF